MDNDFWLLWQIEFTWINEPEKCNIHTKIKFMQLTNISTLFAHMWGIMRTISLLQKVLCSYTFRVLFTPFGVEFLFCTISFRTLLYFYLCLFSFSRCVKSLKIMLWMPRLAILIVSLGWLRLGWGIICWFLERERMLPCGRR